MKYVIEDIHTIKTEDDHESQGQTNYTEDLNKLYKKVTKD
jgi:hypothetical protein